MMNRQLRIAACAVALVMMSGCGSTTNGGGSASISGAMDDGLSGTTAQFNRMRSPCIDQAQRMTGLDRTAISVTDEIRTGGGPLLTLNAGGSKYSCRLEDNGSVTVFSEYAN